MIFAPANLRRFIQIGLLTLIALMPFHAFLSVWAGSLTGHQTIIQAWKEVLLLLLGGIGIALLIRDPPSRQRIAGWPARLALGFSALAVLVTLLTHPSLVTAAFGLKTDLEFLLAFLLALLVATPRFNAHLICAILISGGVVVGFGLLQVTILPPDFLIHFGYGPSTVPPYQTLDPAVSSLRFASTLGGPNQLGAYLALPLALAAVVAIRRRRWWLLSLSFAAGIVLFHTYSRSAWMGALAAVVIVIAILTPKRFRLATLAGLTTAGGVGLWIISKLLDGTNNLQYYILHSNKLMHGQRGSDFEHVTSLQYGLEASLQQPLGHGLGTAGPATLHAGANTPTIIENNYLQIAYETGLAGAIAFVALVGSLMWQLARRAQRHQLAAGTLAALVGVSLTSLVLPAWTDSTTALCVWTAAGAALAINPKEADHV